MDWRDCSSVNNSNSHFFSTLLVPLVNQMESYVDRPPGAAVSGLALHLIHQPVKLDGVYFAVSVGILHRVNSAGAGREDLEPARSQRCA
jgi:hypothetical protein